MKPRLNELSLTVDDGAIWGDVFRRVAKRWAGQRWDRYSYICTQADRRDAELMYLARLWRSGQGLMGHTYAYSELGRFAIDGKRCGGDTMRDLDWP